jgi:hypothetical protein
MILNCYCRVVDSASQATMKSKADGTTVWAVANVHTMSGCGHHAVPGNTPPAREKFRMDCPGLSGTLL